MSALLDGRRIFIAGAANGIGLACVRRFVSEGARVACFDRDKQALDRLVNSLPADRIAASPGDITSTADVDAAMQRCVENFGGIDGLVNSAGIDLVAPVEKTTDDDWRRIMDVDLDGPMHVCRAGLPHLRSNGGGTIVNLSSGAGLQPLKHRTAYCAAKAGLQMFSKALAMEAADWNIRVNVVAPGAVETSLLRESIDADPDPVAAEKAVTDRYLLKRIGLPEEIAATVVWLTSAESSFITGTVVAVDGGRTFH